MEELLEQAVNSPQIHYILENPEIVASKALIGSIVGGTASGLAGQIQGEREIDSLNEKHDQDAYEDAVLSRKEELAEEVERDSAAREIYNHVFHAYTSGKLGAYEEEETRIKENDSKDSSDEFYRQKFSDEDLEYLD